ncbi:MAG: SpoIIIAH-like family protein [Syntrophomonadaceae bacterium]|nr:SpoIIIAH-like family protein [Syntrophomonadaceae bacterium]
MNFKKLGIIILTGSIVLIFALIFWPEANLEKELPLQYNHTNKNSLLADSETPVTNDFFAEYRLERERVRSRQIELLREVLNSTSEEEARKEASLRLVKISEDMEKELQAEGMIKSKGFTDCVVIIQEEITLVVLLEDNIHLNQEADISEMVEKVTGYSEDNVCIIFRKAG